MKITDKQKNDKFGSASGYPFRYFQESECLEILEITTVVSIPPSLDDIK